MRFIHFLLISNGSQDSFRNPRLVGKFTSLARKQFEWSIFVQDFRESIVKVFKHNIKIIFINFRERIKEFGEGES